MRILLTLAALCSLAACQRPAEKAQRKGGPAPIPDLRISEVHVADKLARDRLLSGFYFPGDGWLWTAHKFSVRVDVPPPPEAEANLELDFSVPEELIQTAGTVTLYARVNGTRVGRIKYREPGRQFWKVSVPTKLMTSSPVEVEYELDRWGNDPKTQREIGLAVVSVTIKHPESVVLKHDDAVESAREGYVRMLKQRQQQLPLEKQNELMKLFHEIPVWSQMWFQNVPIEKNPLDLWMYQQIIYEVQPDFIVETGTFRGGSALYWAYTLNGMGLENSRVLTVDVGDYKATAETHPLWKKYVTFFHGSSTDPAIVGEIARRVAGHKVLVTLDSDHSMRHVYEEMKAYAPLVSHGSYLVVEDTHMDGVPTQPNFGPGPLAAVVKFLDEGGKKDFEQDFSREAFIMTFNPGGWLRRK